MKSVTPTSVSESQNQENLRLIEESGGIPHNHSTSDGFTRNETDEASIGVNRIIKVPNIQNLKASHNNVESMLDDNMILSGFD